MRSPFLKFLGLALALCLLLTGCNMIKVDEVMQLKEDIKALDKTNARIVVKYDGGEITYGEAANEYNYQMNYMSMMYSTYGLTMDSSTVASIKENVLKSVMNTRAVVMKAEELGITLTDEEVAECESTVETTYQEQYDKYLAENAAGETDEAKAMATEYALKASGYTKDVLLYQEKASKLIEKVEAQIKGEITEVSEEDVQLAFDVKAAEDEAKYETDTATYESDMSSADTVSYWNPVGYRTVKHILLTPEQEYLDAVSEKQAVVDDLTAQLAALTAPAEEPVEEEAVEEETTEEEPAEEEPAEEPAEEEPAEEEAAEEETAEEAPAEEEAAEDAPAEEPADEPAADDPAVVELQAQLDAANAELDAAKAAAIESVQEKIDDIKQRLDAGEEFQTLIDEYGEDPGMQNEPTASRGYYVSDATTSLDPVFKETAMALENVGDVSEPVLGQYGVHIIRYESEVPEGNIDIETVREELTASTLEKAQEDHYDEQLDAWVAALNPEYHVENLD